MSILREAFNRRIPLRGGPGAHADAWIPPEEESGAGTPGAGDEGGDADRVRQLEDRVAALEHLLKDHDGDADQAHGVRWLGPGDEEGGE